MGSWCPFDGPRGPLTTIPASTSTSAQTTLPSTTSASTQSTSATPTNPSTSSTASSTSTPPTSTTPSCGFVPNTCQKPLEKNFGRLTTKTYRKFQEITGVSQDVASLEDMQLYFFCRQRNEKKCAGLEAPCSCSSPPLSALVVI